MRNHTVTASDAHSERRHLLEIKSLEAYAGHINDARSRAFIASSGRPMSHSTTSPDLSVPRIFTLTCLGVRRFAHTHRLTRQLGS